MRIPLLFLIFTFLGGSMSQLSAQTAPQYTQFFFNKLLFNPAYAGAKEVLSLSAQYRHQWSGLDGAPQTGTLSAHLPFFHNRCGMGISVTNDRIGLLHSNSLTMAYAYRIPFKKRRSTLSFGIQGIFQTDQFNWNNAELLEVQDDVIPFGLAGDSGGNFGLGVFYSSERFYMGLSMPKFFKDGILYKTLLQLEGLNTSRNYYLMSGLSIPLNRNMVLKPAVLVTYNPNVPLTADINLSLLMFNAFWVGATYRWDDAIDAVFQYAFNQRWRMGISFDYTLSELSDYTVGSPEIIIEYLFNKETKMLENLRFFD